ncbi:DegT/DnrJ/EryC1/StrS family aminotransferase [Olleya sp. 1-3]|uniref:DegT/DnrJ/EryC1/StrS family aminotransferase n=1 Tax=Olleya sp. 1-3 TaxID=2058323 RepID=UPI000C345A31|nr:DegT/DnrJ/EryC1/StrS family aminotransferase [Olleya sp. 1-3]PKG52041.1 pyridoxal phosphate-dependent aminotransferase [Olleya sp. 1-3]
MNTKIALSSSHISTNEINFVRDAFAKNQVTTSGDNIIGFEKNLEDYLGQDKKVACLSSGTAAIHLALVQLGVGLNDEVICQTFTFCGSANPIIYQGALPVFVDSDPDTWNICPIHLEEAIKDRLANGKKPKAIIIVHLYGMPCKAGQLIEVANKYQIPIVEDAAESFGSSYKGRKCGTFGTYSIISFNGNKIITTSGGGALVCNTKEDKNQTIFYATQARDRAPHYEHSKIGYNYRMSNISAGIGRGQMQVLDKHINLRRNVNEFYTKIFKSIKGVEIQKEPSKDYYSNFWLSCILIHEDAPFTKAQFQDAMHANNIETRPLWKPMHMQKVFKGFLYFGDQLSQTLFEKGICLPSGSNISLEDLNRIKTVIKSIC